MRREITFLAILALLFAAVPAHAGWMKNGTPVCNASNVEERIAAIEDGAGGIIMVWEDLRGSDRDIYVQKLDEFGNAVWRIDGVPVCTATADQWFPQLCSDGNGGAIITWDDMRGASRDIYAQRVASNGLRYAAFR